MGLAISYDGSIHHGWRLASGATVVMVLTVGFVVVAAVRGVTRAGTTTRPSRRSPRCGREAPGRQLPVADVPPRRPRGGPGRRARRRTSACTWSCAGCRSSSSPCRTPRFPASSSRRCSASACSLGGTAFGLVVVAAVLVLGAAEVLDDASVVGVVLAGSFALGVLSLSSRASPSSRPVGLPRRIGADGDVGRHRHDRGRRRARAGCAGRAAQGARAAGVRPQARRPPSAIAPGCSTASCWWP